MSRAIRSPVYQIDFTAVDAGKRIASSKRRIRWRFGFTNQDALASGGTGIECRGEEHDITLIWSLTSGKRLVLADGQEVHYSNNRNAVFDFSWTMRGNHVLKVTAHANAPLNAHPNFRQYDFFVDGMSFFSMPKVYRLGLADNTPTTDSGALAIAQSSRVPGTYGNYSVPGYGQRSTPGPAKSMIAEIETPHNADEEEAYLKEAIKASLSEAENKEKDINISSARSYAAEPYTSSAPDLLIDFMSEPGPVPAPAPSVTQMSLAEQPFSRQQQPQQQQTHPYAIQYNAPAPTPTPGFASQSKQVVNPAPVTAVDPFAPPTSVPMSSASSFGSSFAPSTFTGSAAPPTAPTPAFAHNPTANAFGMPPPVPVEQPPSVPPPVPEQAPAPPNADTLLTMEPPKDTSLGSNANDAFQKFASMDQFDLVKPNVPAENPFDMSAAPAAPVNGNPAPAPTLAGLKAMSDQTEKKEVMKSTNNNAMVLSGGGQTGNWGGYNNFGGQPMGAAPSMASGQGQPMMNQGYGQPMQQQAYGAAQPSYPQYNMTQQPMGQPPMQQQQFGQPLMQQQPMGQPPMGQPPMQQQPMGQPPMQQNFGPF